MQLGVLLLDHRHHLDDRARDEREQRLDGDADERGRVLDARLRAWVVACEVLVQGVLRVAVRDLVRG